MRAKEYLRQIRKLDIKINQRIKEQGELRSRMFSIGGSSTDSVRVQESREGDKLSNAVSEYLDMEAEIDAMIDDLVNAKHRIIGEIQSLEDERYMQILYMRYVEYKHFYEIADELHYSLEHTIRLHGWALVQFEKDVIKCHI